VKWAYLEKHWKSLAIRSGTLLVPLLGAILLMAFYSHENSRYLIPFGDMNGSVYAVNGVAVLFILSSLTVVAFSLAFYIYGVLRDLAMDPLPSKKVWRLNVLSIGFLLLTGAGLTVLIGGAIFTAFGSLAPCLFSLEEFIRFSRLFAIVVFSVFLLSDSCLMHSQAEQMRLHREMRGKGWRRQVMQKQNGIDFGRLSICLIDVPMLALAVLAQWLNQQLTQNPAFRGFVDMRTTRQPLPMPAVFEETYHLFAIGLDAGIVAATILSSQIVFFALQTRWEYREFLIERRRAQWASRRASGGQDGGEEGKKAATQRERDL
jgi:hypothetical protein